MKQVIDIPQLTEQDILELKVYLLMFVFTQMVEDIFKIFVVFYFLSDNMYSTLIQYIYSYKKSVYWRKHIQRINYARKKMKKMTITIKYTKIDK